MNTRVLIIHPSTIIAQGMANVLQNSLLQLHDHLRVYSDSDDISVHYGTNYVFITSSSIAAKLSKNQLKNSNPASFRFVLIHQQTSPLPLNESHQTIHLTDNQDVIIDKIRSCINSFQQEKSKTNQQLTDRETDVLRLISMGYASKDIADKLNISTHTVITHRKNITEKLGIKSIPGLTVYAILNKIIDTEEISMDDLI